MSKPLTQLEVFYIVLEENSVRITTREMYPGGKSIDKCRQLASIEAVKTTWFWFNNQELLQSIRFFK